MAERVSKFELLQEYRYLNEMFDKLAAFKTKYEYKRGTKIDVFWTGHVIESIIKERERISEAIDELDEEED